MKEQLFALISWASQYNKALVVPASGVVLGLLDRFGITPDMTVEQAVSLAVGLITAFVWAVPNRKK
jgi:ammonia channel protein AmtB